jgi:hypothetical protein
MRAGYTKRSFAQIVRITQESPPVLPKSRAECIINLNRLYLMNEFD